MLLVVVVALLCWIAWEFLPRDGTKPEAATGTVRDLKHGWQAQSKYRLVQVPEVTVLVVLPDGGAKQFFLDPDRAGPCRRGGPIRLIRRETNSGLSEWDLAPAPCGAGTN